MLLTQLRKKAARYEELAGQFVLCTPEWTTGYDWKTVSTDGIGKEGELFVVSGPDPSKELKYELLIANNTFVLYVKERRECISNEIPNSKTVVYEIYDWDVLYPIDHGTIFGWLQSPYFLSKSDYCQ